MSALPSVPVQLAAPDRSSTRTGRERRHLRLIVPPPTLSNRLPADLPEMWERAIEAHTRALEALVGESVYERSEFLSHQQRLRDERTWLAHLQAEIRLTVG